MAKTRAMRRHSKLLRSKKVEILIVKKDAEGVMRLVGATKPVRRFGTFSPNRLR